MRQAGSRERLSIYTIRAELLGRLCLGLAGVLVVYCLFYALRADWLVAGGGTVVVTALLLLATLSRLYAQQMPVALVWLGILGINVGAAIGMIALGPLGIVWYAPLARDKGSESLVAR